MTFGLDTEYQERIDRRRLRRYLMWLVAFVVVLNVVVAIGSAVFAPSVSGPAGSSFVTEEDGIAAWRELLDELGRSTAALREPLSEVALDPRRVALVVIQPDPVHLDGPYLRALRRFVEDGGLAVITAGNPAARDLVPEADLANGELGELAPGLPVAETRSVRTAVFDDGLYFAGTGPGVPLLTDGERRHAALAAQLGRGRVIVVAEKSGLTNRLLATADNAALAVGLTGGREVLFDEYVHGYGRQQGAGGIPAQMKRAAWVVLAGAVVWMWAAGRRMGIPEQPGRVFPPARSEFVSALGASLAKTRPDEAAFGSLRRHGIELLERVAAGSVDGPAAATAAGRVGLSDDEIQALQRPVASEVGATLVGSAVSKLEQYLAGKDDS